MDGKIITSPRQLANEQLRYFDSKIEKIIKHISRPTEDPLKTLSASIQKWESAEDRSIFELRQVTVEETFAAIKLLGNSSAFRHGLIDAIAVKAAADILAKPITHLANMSIVKSEFASSWRKAKLIPIHKGKEGDMSNDSWILQTCGDPSHYF